MYSWLDKAIGPLSAHKLTTVCRAPFRMMGGGMRRYGVMALTDPFIFYAVS